MGSNMKMDEIVYREYVRLVERHDKLLDSSFNDIKLYGVIGSVIGIIGVMKKSGFLSNEKYQDEIYFVVLLLLFFLIAIIAYRDLLKQVYIVHLAFNIKKTEDHIRKNYIDMEDLFVLRKSWHEKYYSLMKKSYSAFSVVFFMPLILFPIYLFWESNKMELGIIMSVIMVIIIVFYSILIGRIYNESRKNEA